MAVLKDHEHVIDCIAWANLECARTIEQADYSGGTMSMPIEADADNQEDEEEKDQSPAQSEPR